MPPVAAAVFSMGVDVPLLAWIGAVLLILGLTFALAGRRPARRDRKARAQAARIGAEGASSRFTEDS